MDLRGVPADDLWVSDEELKEVAQQVIKDIFGNMEFPLDDLQKGVLTQNAYRLHGYIFFMLRELLDAEIREEALH